MAVRRRARASAAFLAAGLLGFFHPAAVKADCPLPNRQSLTVRIAPDVPRRDRTLAIAALSKRAPATRRPEMKGYDYALGLTEATLQAEAKIEMLSLADGAGGFCTAIGTAEIAVSWKTKVRIASELAPGSCLYNAVVRHEQRHVDLDRRLMPQARAEIEAAVSAIARHPIDAAAVEAGQHALRQRLSAAIGRAIDAFSRERNRQQLKIDTPEEYRKVPKLCGEPALQKVLRE